MQVISPGAFTCFRLTYNSLTVMVPFSHVEGITPAEGDAEKRREVARVISFLSEGRCRHYQDWKDRFKEKHRAHAGQAVLLAVAEVS